MGNLHPKSEYYLHTNGMVIYKPHGDVESSSPFVRAVWNANVIGGTPETYLEWLKELKKLGARKSEIIRLVKKQRLTDFIPNAWSELGMEESSDETPSS